MQDDLFDEFLEYDFAMVAEVVSPGCTKNLKVE